MARNIRNMSDSQLSKLYRKLNRRLDQMADNRQAWEVERQLDALDNEFTKREVYA